MIKRNIEAIYPLSPMQQGLLFHSIYEPESGAYIEQMSSRMEGELDEDALKAAWEMVVRRHAILRTAFAWEQIKEPMQVVHKQVRLKWIKEDLTEMDSNAQERQLARTLHADRRQGFDLFQPPLMRCRLVKLGQRSHQFIWTRHHLLLDGWSVSLVLKEVFTLYEARHRGEELSLPDCRPYRGTTLYGCSSRT